MAIKILILLPRSMASVCEVGMKARLVNRFNELARDGRKAVIPYISGGDPLPMQTAEVLSALVEGGADVLELGVPFSDPAADGEIIQRANERALARGVTLETVLESVQTFRVKDDVTPLILMGYLNSFERHGFAQTIKKVADAGVDAVILVDCPIEALPDYWEALRQADVCAIQLLAPTTGEVRRERILLAAEGFIYYVSLRGVTGKQKADASEIEQAVRAVKAVTDTPVCIGFGIRDGETAKAMASFADGVVIGSALVAQLHDVAENGGDVFATARAFVKNIRDALDN